MSIFSKLMSALRGGKKPTGTLAPAQAVEPVYTIPTVKFDPNRVSEAVKADLRSNIQNVKEFDETIFNKIYDSALQSILKGRDLATLFNALWN